MKWVAGLLLVADIVVFGYAWYATYMAVPDRAPPRAELQPEKVRLLTAAQAQALAAKNRPRACIEWGAFVLADLARAGRALDAENMRFVERRTDGGSRWWVHIAALPSKRIADQRAAEIRKLNVTEDPVVQEDGRVFSISLGLFSSETAAQNVRDALAKQGIRDVAVLTRDSTNTRVYLRMRDVTVAGMNRLGVLRQDFPGSDLRDCPPER